MLVNPARYSPATAPVMVRQAPAKKRNTSAMAGISSLRAAASGLPQFCDSSLANAAPSASMRSASLSSRAARSFGAVCDQPSNAALAALAAASTWPREASLTLASTLPVAGFSTSSVRPSPAVSFPLMSSLVCMP